MGPTWHHLYAGYGVTRQTRQCERLALSIYDWRRAPSWEMPAPRGQLARRREVSQDGGHGAQRVSLAGAATSIFFVATNTTNTCLSRQNTSFVPTKVRLSRQKFCRGRHTFVATGILLLRQKTCLSRQKWYLWQIQPPISGWPTNSSRHIFKTSSLVWFGLLHLACTVTECWSAETWKQSRASCLNPPSVRVFVVRKLHLSCVKPRHLVVGSC